MMKFNEIIQILFLTAIISVNGAAKITQTKQVVIQPHFEGEMICLWFQSEPPYEGDGGSRFYEPPKPDQNSDESLFQV